MTQHKLKLNSFNWRPIDFKCDGKFQSVKYFAYLYAVAYGTKLALNEISKPFNAIALIYIRNPRS